MQGYWLLTINQLQGKSCQQPTKIWPNGLDEQAGFKSRVSNILNWPILFKTLPGQISGNTSDKRPHQIDITETNSPKMGFTTL